MAFKLVFALIFLGIAVIQLVTGRAPTEVGGLNLPGSFARRRSPWRFWFMFGLNASIGTLFLAGAIFDRN